MRKKPILEFAPPCEIVHDKLSDCFKKITRKNKDKTITNVFTNSAISGIVPQREYFDKDIAVEGNTANYSVIEKGDFVYNPRKSSHAPYGPFLRNDNKETGIVSPLYTCVRSNNRVNSDYLKYYFESSAWHRFIYANGSTGARHDRVSMTNDILLNIPVTYPENKEVQKKIGDMLSLCDEQIKTQTNMVSILETRRRGLVQDIFSQQIRFKDANGNDYPKWGYHDICDAYKKKNMDPRKTPEKEYLEYSMPAFDNDKHAECKHGSEMNSTRMIIDRPMILMNKLNVHKKRIWLVENPEKNAVATTEFVPIVNKDNNLGFIYYFLQTEKVLNILLSLTAGTSNSQKRVHPEDILNLDVKFPCIEEQNKIAEFLSKIDQQIDIEKQKLEAMKNIKKGLLQQLFV